MPSPRTLLLSLVLLAAPLQAEFLVSEPGMGPNLGRMAVIAPTDSGFLAVWTEGTASRVLRLSPTGEPVGLPFENGLPYGSWRAAASDGEQVMVIGDCNYTMTCVGRLDASGQLLGTSVVANHGGENEDARIAWNGEEFLAIYTEGVASGLYWGRYAVKIAPDGSAGERQMLGGADYRAPDLATAGGEFFTLLRNEANETFLARVSGEGVEESRVLSLPFESHAVAIGGRSDGMLLIAALDPDPERLHIRIFRHLDPVTDWIPIEEAAGDAISVVPSGSGWLIVASSNRVAPFFRGIRLTPVSPAGVAGTIQQIVTSFSYSGPKTANAAAHGVVAVTWTGTDQDFGVRLLLAGENGRVLRAPATVSIGPAMQEAPAALWGGGTILATWSEVRPDGWFAVKARAFNQLGTPYGPAVSVPFSGRNQKEPAVSFDGDSFLVVWSEGGESPDAVVGVRISRDGVVLDRDEIHLFDTTPPPFTSTVAWDSPDVAWNGTAWVVVAVDGAHQIVARRVSPGGTVLDPVPVAIDTEETSALRRRSQPRVACGSSGCLAAWSRRDWQTGPPPFLMNPEVWSARIGPALDVIAPGPVLLLRHFQTAPPTKVSWNQQVREWVVVTGTGDARRVDASGVPIDEAASQGDQILPSLIPEREGWRLAWTLLQPFPAGDVFHGWTRTGKLTDVRERWKLTSSSDREADVQLVDAPEPLAFFVRTSNASNGTRQQIVGRFLAESERIATDLILLASRSDTRTLELSWTTNIEGVRGYALEACYEEGCETRPWRVVWSGFTASTASFVHERLAGKVRIVALSPSGRIESNAIDFDGAPPRRRPVAR